MIEIRIEGISTVLRELDRWNNKILKEMSEIIQSGAIAISDEARRLAPVDTGLLQSRIKKKKIDALTAEVRDNVNYGVFVELGTHNMKAQPFMRPAVKKILPKIEQKLKRMVP